MINELIQVKENETVTTSFLVAEKFNKEHRNVIRKIESLITDIETDSKLSASDYFEKSEQKDAHGQLRPMYYMNRDGFTLLAMGFTGSEALKWKLTYIQAFNEMEKRLHSQQLPDNRFAIAKLISRTPYRNLPAIMSLYPEYFSQEAIPDSLEYISDLNTSYRKWIEDYGITKDWIEDFPTSDIYNNYMQFCIQNRLKGMGKKIFYSTLESDFGLTKKQKKDGFRYFISV